MCEELLKDIYNMIENIEYKVRMAIIRHLENKGLEDINEIILSEHRSKDVQRNIDKSIIAIKKAEKEKDMKSYSFYINGLAQLAAGTVVKNAGIKFPWSNHYDMDELENWIELAEEWKIDLDYETMREEKNKFDSLIPCYEDLELVKIEDVVHIYGSKIDKIPNEMFMNN